MTSNATWNSQNLRRRVGVRVADFVEDKRQTLTVISPELDPVSSCVGDFLAGGKGLRGIFLYWGWRAAGGSRCEEIITAAAAMELVQAGALIHDDVMDAADERRGGPSVHERFAETHRQREWSGSPDRFGVAAAILIGDLCLGWADELLIGCGLPDRDTRRAKPYFDAMRTELMAGQYLDVLEQARATADVEAALRVASYKTAKYTIERPLHIGAALGGASGDLLACLTRYAMPLGRAFQLRDDLLGVFGDPERTGKPAGGDLREGKRTVLVALALRAADSETAGTIAAGLGNRDLDPTAVAALRQLIESTGARESVEGMIEQATRDALSALSDPLLSDEPRAALTGLARTVSQRTT